MSNINKKGNNYSGSLVDDNNHINKYIFMKNFFKMSAFRGVNTNGANGTKASNSFTIISLFVSLIFSITTFAAEYSQSAYLNKSAIAVNTKLNVTDNSYAAEVANPAWYSAKRKHLVRLTYNRENKTDVATQGAWSYTINYTLQWTGNSVYENKSISINYTPGCTNCIYEAINENDVATFVGYSNVTLTINSITGTPPDDIRLELSTITERYTDLAASAAPSPLIAYNSTTSELTWGYVPGAEAYDVEWTFIDVRDVPPTFSNPQDAFNYKAPIRVTTCNQYYNIDQVYPAGKLYFRVRALGRYINMGTDYTHVSYGAWGYSTTLGGAAVTYTLSTDYESNKNWSYSAVYAEEGKAKKGVSYSDGGGKSRQSASSMNSDNTVIVGENKYDREGRPVLAMLPTPVAITNPLTAFNYKVKLNSKGASGSQTEYTYADFEMGGKGAGSTTAIGRGSGAGQYYSSANPFTTDPFTNYIDDAGGAAYSDGGYPFTQVMYTRDNTGRIAKTTAGAGATFKLGAGRELSYFYGTANGTELHRMFGTNVGVSSHYKKNFSVDANGQGSVSYLDQEGRVVATCLAGTPPSNVSALSSYTVTPLTVSLNENNVVDQKENKSTIISQVMNVAATSTYTFTYDMKGVIYGANIAMDGLTILNNTVTPPTTSTCKPTATQAVCADCKYKLQLSVYDPDGIQVTPGSYSVPPVSTSPPTWTFSNPNTPTCTTPYPYINQYTPSSPTITFSLNFTKLGNYSIIKTLTVDTTGIDTKAKTAFTNAGYNESYRQSLIQCYVSNTDFTQCDNSCSESCLSQVLRENPTWAADQTLYAAKITAAKNQCIALTCNSVNPSCKAGCRTQVLTANPTWAADPVTYATQITNAVNSCITTQCNQTGSIECSGMLHQMITDVSPGGDEYQGVYALPVTSFWNRVSSLLNMEGCELVPTCINLPGVSLATLQNPALFQPAWADQLIKAHRDYCHYLNCVAAEPGKVYDISMAGVADDAAANALGYLDPMGFGRAGSNTAFPTPMNNLGITVQTVTAGFDPLFSTQSTTTCTRYKMMADLLKTGYTFGGYTDIWHYVFNASSPPYATGGLTYNAANRWKVFRGLYLDAKTAVDDQINLDALCVAGGGCTYDSEGYNIGNCVYTSSCGTNSPCYISCPYYNDSKVVLRPPVLTTTATDIQNGYDQAADCGQICEQNAQIWMEKLAHYADSTACSGWSTLTDTEKASMKYNFMLFCQNSCGLVNPMGLILAADLPNPITNTYLLAIKNIINAKAPACVPSLNYLSSGSPYQVTCPGTNGVTVNATKPSDCFTALVTYLNNYVIPNIGTSCFNLSTTAPAPLSSNCLGGLSLSLSGSEIRLSTSSSSCASLRCQRFSFYKSDGAGGGTAINVSDMKSIATALYTGSSPINTAPSGLVFKNISCVVNTTSSGPVLAYLYEKTDCQQITVLQTVAVTSYCVARAFTNATAYTVTANYTNMRDECIAKLKAQDTALANAHMAYLYDRFKTEYMKAHFANCFTSPQLSENFYYQYNSSEHHYTLYYYDQAGNLVQTVPPKGCNLVSTAAFTAGVYNNTTEPAHTYKTRYSYNGLNQVRTQETPDGGLTAFYYDDKGRLRFSQNAKQLAANVYSYTMYDNLSRITEVGQSNDTYATFSQNVNNSAFPATGLTQVTLTAYDKVFDNTSALQALFTGGGQKFLRTRVATSQIFEGTYTRLSTTGLSYSTNYSYDEHGNVTDLVQDNTLLASLGNDIRYKFMRYKYQLVSGNVMQAEYQPGKPDQFYHRYSYDADNRLTVAMTSNRPVLLPLSSFTSCGVENWEKDAKYFYYKHGPLGRTETGEDKVQGTDMGYTINGWLKGINAATLDNSRDMGKDARPETANNNSFIAKDALGYSLGYFDNDYSAIGVANTSAWLAATLSTPLSTGNYRNLYNGNIANTTSAFLDNNEANVSTMGKAYKYDQLNRLTNVNTFTNVIAGSADLINRTNSFSGSYDNGYYQEIFSYDANGNISTTDRWGNGTKMDQFTYKYQEPSAYTTTTNKLRYVLEGQTVTTNYTDDIDPYSYTTVGNENYGYDAIGNLTSDKAENISQIDWNIYGKVSKVTGTTGTTKNDIEFKYDPAGNRICKIVKQRLTGGIRTEDYWTYTYYVRDAQGNVMAVYNRPVTNTSGTVSDKLTLKEHHIYGSSRLGIETKSVNLGGVSFPFTSYASDNSFTRPGSFTTLAADAIAPATRLVGDKAYELSNHLGNVMSVISDRKVAVPGNNAVSSFEGGDYSLFLGGDYSSLNTTSQFKTGTKSIVLAYPGTMWGPAVKLQVNSGDLVTASVYVKFTTGTKSGLFYIGLMDAAGNWIGVTGNPVEWYSTYTTTSGSWQKLSFNYVVPNGLSANPAYVFASMYIPDGTFATTYYDDLQINIQGTGPIVTSYRPDVLSSTDFFAYGGQTPGRKYNTTASDFGFNGKREDVELYGEGNSYDFGARLFDPRLGRFMRPDPARSGWSFESQYAFAGNTPIWAIDKNGEKIYFSGSALTNAKLQEAYNTLMKTESGRKLLAIYQTSNTHDIYIKIDNNDDEVASTYAILSGDEIGLDRKIKPSKFKGVDNQKEFSNWIDFKLFGSPKTAVSLINFNINELNGKGTLDKYELAEALYHEIWAHIYAGGGTAAEDHSLYGKTATSFYLHAEKWGDDESENSAMSGNRKIKIWEENVTQFKEAFKIMGELLDLKNKQRDKFKGFEKQVYDTYKNSKSKEGGNLNYGKRRYKWIKK